MNIKGKRFAVAILVVVVLVLSIFPLQV